MSKPLVSIIGRPNVGKSTLFNRLTGSKRSIVGDEPGITRDRIYGTVEWRARSFDLVDTGGLVPDDEALIPRNIFRQADLAISESAAIIWVVDARSGATPLDEELANLLRATGKPVLLAANKAETRRVENEASEFFRFGFEMFPVSAEHGSNVGDLLDGLLDAIDAPETVETRPETDEIRLAIIGRPNVGKSSILNRLLGEERVIVTEEAGTTRDAVDTKLETEEGTFLLIDTAGIRRKGKTKEMAEKLSVVMARKALERADVAVMVIDAVEGVTHLDSAIAGYAMESGCSIILVVNKWDLVSEKDTGTASEFERTVRMKMKFLDWAPVITASALTGQRVVRIPAVVKKAHEARCLRVPTGRLNDFFARNVMQPRRGGGTAPGRSGRSAVNVKYLTQAGIRPPTFVLFTSGSKKTRGLHFSYLRYLENRLRSEFGFFATPIRIRQRKGRKRNGKP